MIDGRRTSIMAVVDWVADLPVYQHGLFILAALSPLLGLMYLFPEDELLEGWFAFAFGSTFIGMVFFLAWRGWLLNFEREHGQRDDG